jgi:hypothetical protein
MHVRPGENGEGGEEDRIAAVTVRMIANSLGVRPD